MEVIGPKEYFDFFCLRFVIRYILQIPIQKEVHYETSIGCDRCAFSRSSIGLCSRPKERLSVDGGRYWKPMLTTWLSKRAMRSGSFLQDKDTKVTGDLKAGFKGRSQICDESGQH